MLAKYSKALVKAPYKTKMITSAFVFIGSDLVV